MRPQKLSPLVTTGLQGMNRHYVFSELTVIRHVTYLSTYGAVVFFLSNSKDNNGESDLEWMTGQRRTMLQFSAKLRGHYQTACQHWATRSSATAEGPRDALLESSRCFTRYGN